MAYNATPASIRSSLWYLIPIPFALACSRRTRNGKNIPGDDFPM
jgi:hypothetical protein